MDFVKELQSITKPVFLMDAPKTYGRSEEEIAPHDRFLNEEESSDSLTLHGRELESDGANYASSALEDLTTAVGNELTTTAGVDTDIDTIQQFETEYLKHEDLRTMEKTDIKGKVELETTESLIESLSQESSVSLHSNTSDRFEANDLLDEQLDEQQNDGEDDHNENDEVHDHDEVNDHDDDDDEDDQRHISRQSSQRFPVILHNHENNTTMSDMLHHSGNLVSSQCIPVTASRRQSLPQVTSSRPSSGISKSVYDIIKDATEFIDQYFQHVNRMGSDAHEKRLAEVRESIEKWGTYNLTTTELNFGAKTAWRNSSRCIGRQQWNKLQVFDARRVTNVKGMYDAICKHLSYATNKGAIRSAITIFPGRGTSQGTDYCVWNSLLISYAGYTQPDGSVIGDPATVEFTKLCQEMGWKGQNGKFDILPLVLQAKGHDPQFFELPPELVLEVQLSHPKYDWFAELGLKWFAVPCVSNMVLEIGGLEFPACPYNRWHVETEIGAKIICGTLRYNMLQTIAERLELDVPNEASLWRDFALVETNLAVLHSFEKSSVSIDNHHSIAQSFLQHMENEFTVRQGCPAEWEKIVPSLSVNTTSPLYHQEMLNYQLKPQFIHRGNPSKTHVWKGKKSNRSYRDDEGTEKKRIKATILYATEGGKSERYARCILELYQYVFDAKVMSMDAYDVVDLDEEELIIIIASTFGNGQPPHNGESFFQHLEDLVLLSGSACTPKQTRRLTQSCEKYIAIQKDESDKRRTSSGSTMSNSGMMAGVRYAVFGLGSSAYPHFCAFASAMDVLLRQLGADRLCEMKTGDDMGGQEESFQQWGKTVFKLSCENFCPENRLNLDTAVANVLGTSDSVVFPEKFRVSVASSQCETDICDALEHLHGVKVYPCSLIARKNLQDAESTRQTILLELDTKDAPELDYEPGDHVLVYPTNEKSMVQRVLRRLDYVRSPDVVIRVEIGKSGKTHLGNLKVWTPVSHLPLCSVRTAIERYLDINTPPTPSFLRMLAAHATLPKDREKLLLLGQGSIDYDEWLIENYSSFAEVLESFPSLRVPSSFLLTHLPLLKPRYFVVSSSAKMYPGRIHLTVAVVKYRTRAGKGTTHNGVCSTWLNQITPTDIVPLRIVKSNAFHLPEDVSKPVVMVGPGTGIAPFRGFWQQRQVDLQFSGSSRSERRRLGIGDFILVFGCRNSDVDYLYEPEIAEAKEDGTLSNIFTAFSRERDRPKKYVQDTMTDNSRHIYRAIYRNEGHLFVCGDITMATEVRQTIQKIVAQHGSMTDEKAKEYINDMLESGRYHEDIFGITLNTTNVMQKLSSVNRHARVLVQEDSPGRQNFSPRRTRTGSAQSLHMQDLRAKFSSPPKPLDGDVHTLRRRVTATVLMDDGPRKALTEDEGLEEILSLGSNTSPGIQTSRSGHSARAPRVASSDESRSSGDPFDHRPYRSPSPSRDRGLYRSPSPTRDRSYYPVIDFRNSGGPTSGMSATQGSKLSR